MLSPLVTTWVAQVRWGDRRLHTDALDREGRRRLVLGRHATADVVLGVDATATLEWTELGLYVTLSPGFTGRASVRGDRPCGLGELLARGRARERGDDLGLLLEPGDTLSLAAGSLKVELGAAPVPVRRLPLEVKSLGLLALALVAVALVFASI